MLKNHFSRLAAYNLWANKHLYDSVDLLQSDEFMQDKGLAFRSVCGTLNHLLVVDRIWMRRMTGTDDAGIKLDDILSADRAVLREMRTHEDHKIVSFIDDMNESDFLRECRYTNMSGQVFCNRYNDIFTHFFNHHTHHRGQIHALLTQFGQSSTSLDYIYFMRDCK